METEINKEFQSILNEIIKQDWPLETWAKNEAPDWFQRKHFTGGFHLNESDSDTEGEFSFSFFDENSKECWFTFKLHEAPKLQAEGFTSLELTDANDSD